MSEWKCNKCQAVFTSEKRYVQHLHKQVPCDFECKFCKCKLQSRGGYYKHMKKCSEKHDDTNSTVNNVNNVDASETTHTTNNNNNLTNVNNNNMVFLTPFGLEHKMMAKETEYREEVLGGARDKILDIVRQQNFVLAYQTLFNHIHGNMDRPEQHNIFIEDREKDEVCLFTGKQFSYERADLRTPGLYRRLMVELKWMVGTADIPFSEKDQLLHDILCHWRLVNEEKDEDIRRMLYNNKPVVQNTVNNNQVKPNKDLLEDYYGFERGTLKTFDMDIKLPN